MTKPNCYACIHRGEIPGDAHSMCRHPATALETSKSFENLIDRLNGCAEPAGAEELDIRADPHGIRSGWFHWPENFDPVWLENCTGFEPKEWPACPECNLKHNPKHHTRLHDKPNTKAEQHERKLEQGE